MTKQTPDPVLSPEALSMIERRNWREQKAAAIKKRESKPFSLYDALLAKDGREDVVFKQTPDPVLPTGPTAPATMSPKTVGDAYLEFMCADEATQSELWNKSMKALQKYPLKNLRLSEKEGSVQTMMNEQDPETSDGPMDGNGHYWSAVKISVEDGADVEATLALAFEQRTANLIAYLEHTEGSAYVAASATIKARLGL